MEEETLFFKDKETKRITLVQQGDKFAPATWKTSKKNELMGEKYFEVFMKVLCEIRGVAGEKNPVFVDIDCRMDLRTNKKVYYFVVYINEKYEVYSVEEDRYENPSAYQLVKYLPSTVKQIKIVNNGDWKKLSNEKGFGLYSKQEPYIFTIEDDGNSIYYYHNTKKECLIENAGAKCLGVIKPFSIAEKNDCVIVFYTSTQNNKDIVNYFLFYKDYTISDITMNIFPEDSYLEILSIEPHRLNDFRIGLVVNDLYQKKWKITSMTESYQTHLYDTFVAISHKTLSDVLFCVKEGETDISCEMSLDEENCLIYLKFNTGIALERGKKIEDVCSVSNSAFELYVISREIINGDTIVIKLKNMPNGRYVANIKFYGLLFVTKFGGGYFKIVDRLPLVISVVTSGTFIPNGTELYKCTSPRVIGGSVSFEITE